MAGNSDTGRDDKLSFFLWDLISDNMEVESHCSKVFSAQAQSEDKMIKWIK